MSSAPMNGNLSTDTPADAQLRSVSGQTSFETNAAVTVLGVAWSHDQPAVRVRQDDDGSMLLPLIGLSLNYKAGPRRRCIGRTESDHAWSDCARSPLPNALYCDDCTGRNAAHAAQLHHSHHRDTGELSAEMREHLDQPNNLYLAAFRDGSIKVGTSTTSRLETRLAEQGAWVARIVSRSTDGVMVRVLEDAVTEHFGLPQSISIKRKIDGQVQPRADDDIHRELDRWTTQVHRLIRDLDSAQLAPIDERWAFVGRYDPPPPAAPYPLKLSVGNHSIAILAACGRIVFFERPGDEAHQGQVFCADLRTLFGHELRVGSYTPDPLAMQASLF